MVINQDAIVLAQELSALPDEDAKIKRLKQEIRKLTNKLDEKQTGIDLLHAAFREAYSESVNIAPIKVKPKKSSKKYEEVAVLHLSDIHFGKKTDTYNFSVASERMEYLFQSVIRVTEIRRHAAKIDKCRLYLGGDFVEGDGIFPGQAHEVDQDLVDQAIKNGPEVIADGIMTLLENFQSIHICGVPGNHGRVSKTHAKRLNWDSLFYETLRLIFNKVKESKRITWDLPLDRKAKNWFAVDNVLGWGCMIVHGDQVRGQLGFPWYGFGKKVAGWIDVVQEPWDYLFAGHFHTCANFTINKRIILANGTSESDNEYAAESLAAGGEPSQRLCFFCESHGLVADSPIYLTTRQPNGKK